MRRLTLSFTRHPPSTALTTDRSDQHSPPPAASRAGPRRRTVQLHARRLPASTRIQWTYSRDATGPWGAATASGPSFSVTTLPQRICGGSLWGRVRVAWAASGVLGGYQQAAQAAGLRQPHLEGGYYRDDVPTALIRGRSRRTETSNLMVRAIRTRVPWWALNSFSAGTARETQTCRGV